MSAAPPIRRRPERAEDSAFRHALFRASRSPAERLDGIAPEVAEVLFRHQVAGQEMTYRARHPGGRFEVIESAGSAVGRLVTDLSAADLRLVDLALSPGWRGRGIGTALLRALQDEAGAAGVPLRLSVVRGNAGALRFYARLGFAPAGGTQIHLDLEWTA